MTAIAPPRPRSISAGLLAIMIVLSVLPVDSRAEAGLVNKGEVSPFRRVADRVVPAVVSIEVARDAGAAMEGHPMLDQFRQFMPDLKMPENHEPIPGSGSGFLIDGSGGIVTNNHVVRDAESITVTLAGEKTAYEAEVLGSDPATDLALLRITNGGGREFPFVPLGDSDQVRVGDWAIAVGNPLGELEGTLTVGVISAKGRSNLRIMGGTPSYQDFLQTDAAINFGNSGGPLVDIHGQAIGINTAINASGQSIGFAIPANMAARIIEQIREHGRVVRAYMGVRPRELDSALAEALGLSIETGILIEEVVPGYPADEAGIRSGDVLTQFGGVELEDLDRFRFLVAERGIGESISVRLHRDGKSLRRKLVLVEFPTDQLAQAPAPEDWFGISVEDPASSQMGREMNLEGEQGVLVVSVRQGSAGARADVRPGDLILKIRGREISDMTNFEEAAREEENSRKRVGLLVKRRTYKTFLYITP